MEELFGKIGPTGIAAIVAIITQILKDVWQLSNRPALLASLAVSLVFFVPFYLAFYWGTIPTAQLVYSSFFYAVSGWLLAAGFYSTFKTGMGK